MCSDDRNEYVLKLETNKPLETNEHIVGNSCAILSMVSPIFSGSSVVVSGDVVNDGLKYINSGLN